jgi:hypothetical protein
MSIILKGTRGRLAALTVVEEEAEGTVLRKSLTTLTEVVFAAMLVVGKLLVLGGRRGAVRRRRRGRRRQRGHQQGREAVSSHPFFVHVGHWRWPCSVRRLASSETRRRRVFDDVGDIAQVQPYLYR